MSGHLISDYWLDQNRKLHADGDGFGGSGWKHSRAVVDFAAEVGARTILDYGCGEGSLRRMLKKGIPDQERVEFRGKVHEYDPAVRGKTVAVPSDLVVCTDVLEHVEPGCLRAVCAHVRSLARRGAYLAVATRTSNKHMPDGGNAHLVVESADWWLATLHRHKIRVARHVVNLRDDGEQHSLVCWVRP
jgi:hypothetical protein